MIFFKEQQGVLLEVLFPEKSGLAGGVDGEPLPNPANQLEVHDLKYIIWVLWDGCVLYIKRE